MPSSSSSSFFAEAADAGSANGGDNGNDDTDTDDDDDDDSNLSLLLINDAKANIKNVDIYHLDVTDHYDYDKNDIPSSSTSSSSTSLSSSSGSSSEGGGRTRAGRGRGVGGMKSRDRHERHQPKRRHEITVDKDHCRDSFHFDCDAVWNNNDCETVHRYHHSPSSITNAPTTSTSSSTSSSSSRNDVDDDNDSDDLGVVIGDVYCPSTCGRCNTDRYYDVSSSSSSSLSSSSLLSSVVLSDQKCYTFGKQHLNFTFVNVEPQREDWIGIYTDGVDLTDLGPPVSWYWLCDSNKRDKCKASRGTATFPWLPPGKYKAVLSRNLKHGKGPYASFGPSSAYAASETFEVVRDSSGCAMRRGQRQRLRLRQLGELEEGEGEEEYQKLAQHQKLFLRRVGGGPLQ